jgi:GntR family transcriptional regulator of arabinose operon
MLDIDRIKAELAAQGPAPLHFRLRNAIQTQILDGTLNPKEALPSERALEEQLGVSRTTIRQALRALAEAGLIKPIVGAGSFVLEQPTPRTTDLGRGATSETGALVGVVVPDQYFYVYYAQLASAINNRLREAGYRVDMSLHNAQTENLARIVDGLLEQGVVGVALCPTDDEAVLPILDRLRARGVSLVMIARFWDYREADYVGADNERIGYEATRHLIELGHTGIVHLTYAYGSTARGRAGGYVRAMLEAGLAPRILMSGIGEHLGTLVDLGDYLAGDHELGNLCSAVARREVTAVFCFNDDMAGWIQKELRKANLVVPRDVSLVGVDDLPYAEFFDAPLTTFALPGEEIGQRAAELLIRRLGGEQFVPQRIRVPARFVQRFSSAPPPTGP